MKYILILTFFMISCGDPEIILENNVYEPKIVIDGYLIVDRPIERIFIKNNIASGVNIDAINLFVSDAEVFITDLSTNTRVQLTYDPDPYTLSYYDELNVLGIVKPNTKYRIEVNATINGTYLSASSVTQTPANSFKVYQPADSVKTYPRNDAEREDEFKFTFDVINGAKIYVTRFRPMDKRYETLIQTPRNIYFEDEISREDFGIDYNDFESSGEIFNVADDMPTYEASASWFRFHFNSRYQVVTYAGDQNYKNYYLTYNQVVDFDGNIDEPDFNIDGDGIGVFGSFATDTIYLNVEL